MGAVFSRARAFLSRAGAFFSRAGAFFSRAGQIKYALPNDIHGMRIALAGGAFDTIIPSASTFGASSSGTKHPPFDVFINHCGKDVKQTLASRIYKSLNATGLKVFLDKPELKYGDLLPKALEEVMATATICIAIFSEHYAESPWCLAELEYMVKARKTIIPVFCHVQPSDLRWADGGKGAYVEAFSHHQKKRSSGGRRHCKKLHSVSAASLTVLSVGEMNCKWKRQALQFDCLPRRKPQCRSGSRSIPILHDDACFGHL